MVNGLVIVSGLSGAGKTVALKGLEDNNFQVIDNLPISLFDIFLEQINTNNNPIAVGIDARNLNFSATIIDNFAKKIREQSDVPVIYLECSEEQLLKRYNETRRPHPINAEHLRSAILQEKSILAPIKAIADLQIDTTELQVRQLHKLLQHYFHPSIKNMLKIQCMSFSYRKGVPLFADFVVDMRFLSNPFYVSQLQDMSGQDKQVQDFLKKDLRWSLVAENFYDFLINLIKGYQEQGRSYFTIGFGCTGGQHRSVFAAEFFFTELAKMGYDCHIEHRDLRK
jgi:UPF0042 nucleotide-binding protein